MTRNINLAVVAGDGIGIEVVEQGLKVLEAALASSDVKVDQTAFNLGAKRWHATGETLTDEDLAAIRTHDAILLGAIGDPTVPSGVLERGLLLKLRFSLDHYVNLRPGKLYPGVQSPLANPGEIDFVVVREGTEGPYVGNGGSIRTGTPHEVANEVSVNTAFGVERVVRDAFARAQARPRKHLTLVHVDAATIFLTTNPSRFDVIVTDNLFGDILTDQAAAITGGIGLAASANINPDRTAPSMFEPVHGSAPDIAGQGKADPTATVLSVAMLLAHLGYDAESAKVEAAVAADLAERAGRVRSTAEIGTDLAQRVAD
jgi:3-isopropylmalate dehydrogenase